MFYTQERLPIPWLAIFCTSTPRLFTGLTRDHMAADDILVRRV